MLLIPTARSVFQSARRWGEVYVSTGWGSTTSGPPPGRRTSYPHAESDEEEFIYVLEGYPEVWINGYLWKLEPGDSVVFPLVPASATPFSITPSRKFVCWWWARPTRSTTAFITRSIPAMPRRAGIVGLTIRRSSSVHTASRGKSNHFR